ncbi:branched-chain amino acid ABC transporter permease [Pusillimonas caeni]|uniref:branched-chain amino acid ABC transporter permease n=1 Tax=Pusillimonas caeni TaxID=1348472 RepID=UPI000E59931B|nr:branched-chain amino acid ABC transporter permease [Pusillimonas caeni]TFL10210.1 branched-chain amino acid ABC transporter permease [Pusillimonas caeni]
MIGQLIISGLAQGSIYALVALGMTILFRSTGVVNFGYGALFMAGAFTLYVFTQVLGFGFGAGFLATVIVMAVFGMVVERCLIRPIINRPHVTVAMMTVAVSYFLTGVARFFWGQEVLPMPPVLDVPPVVFADLVITGQDLIIASVCLVLVTAFFIFFAATRQGKLMQAASQVPRGAALVGINVPGFQCTMWAAASIVAAIAGTLVAPVTMLYPDMGAHLLIKAFAAMTLGGFGHFGGAVVGGILIGVAEQLAGGYISTAMIDIFAYLAIIATLLIVPSGLFGRKEVVRV